MGGVDVEDEFDAAAARAKAGKDAYEENLALMYDLLPAMRRKKIGPKAIEERSHGLIPRDTASRRTAPVIGTSRKPRTQAAA
jgi:hypothetical protein